MKLLNEDKPCTSVRPCLNDHCGSCTSSAAASELSPIREALSHNEDHDDDYEEDAVSAGEAPQSPHCNLLLTHELSGSGRELVTVKNNVNDNNRRFSSGTLARSSPITGSPARRRKTRFALGGGSSSSLFPAVLYNRLQGRSQSLPFIQKFPKQDSRKPTELWDVLTVIFSTLYGKLMVVLGIAFPLAEIMSASVPHFYYEGFYLYLYFGSMAFLVCVYCVVLKQRAVDSVISSSLKCKEPMTKEMECNMLEAGLRPKPAQQSKRSRYGSFYLRMATIGFGVGSMIYAGLEFGQFFDRDRKSRCNNVLLAVTPATRMVFIIAQMQFIFLSNKQLTERKYAVLKRFGLMHMIATNLCIWFSVLIHEVKHGILEIYIASRANNLTQFLNATIENGNDSVAAIFPYRIPGDIKELKAWELFECRRTNIMGTLVQNASPFLFPCAIEFSLISAVILYTMWKDVSSLYGNPQSYAGAYGNKIGVSKLTTKLRPGGNSSQQLTVDCAGAHKGLFSGILMLVITIISLIMFFVLIKEVEYKSVAVFQVNMVELTLYICSMIATLTCAYRIRNLKYDTNRRFELDNMLLVTAQTGLYIYSLFSIIAGYFSDHEHSGLLITSLASFVQTTLQTVFILDAWWRRCTTASQIRRKPGRQLVTFLLVTNIAMWVINRLEDSQKDFHPVELEFYGMWAWTIITHISMPLAIFYRFHSTVCLCEIWKSTYKMRLLPPAR